jgi:microcystin-dependent protein
MMLKKLGLGIACFVALAAAYLFIPPPQHASAQFADQSTYGGTSTGSANAQTIAIPNLATRPIGVPFRFIPGFTNTGPTTINDGLGAVAVVRPSSIGNVALSGAELQAGELTSIVFTGSVYQLFSNVGVPKIGATVEYRGGAVPRGTLIEDGSCVSQTTYAALFSVTGTTYGSCSAGLFALPDSRGTMFAALDNQGVNGSANRITTASCAAPNAIGLCGHETYAIITTNLPPYTPSGSVAVDSVSPYSSGTITNWSNGTGITLTAFVAGQLTNTTVHSTGALTGTAQGGASTPHTILNPVLLGRRAIIY